MRACTYSTARTAVWAWETVNKRHISTGFNATEALRFNPSVPGINLVFLDSLAQPRRPYGTAGHPWPWKEPSWARGAPELWAGIRTRQTGM